MQKNIVLFIALLLTTIAFSGCTEQYTMGEFDVDESMVPAPNSNPPQAPTGLTASYNDYCDRVELSWDTVPRASSYDVYMGEALIAGDITGTSFSYTSAPPVEVTYRVFASNHNGSSLNFAATIGKRGAIPAAPANFQASKGTSESVVLTWDETEHAQYYQVQAGGVLLADSITATFFIDDNAPLTLTEYSLKAYSFCGESAWVKDSGRAGVATELIDQLDNMNYFHSSENIVIQKNNPAGFGGDAGRAARTSPVTAYLTYHYPGLFDFSVDLWIVSTMGVTSNLKFYTSADGIAYHAVPVKQSVQNLGYRSLVTFKPDGVVTGINYLKVEMSGSDEVWKDQIAKITLKYIN